MFCFDTRFVSTPKKTTRQHPVVAGEGLAAEPFDTMLGLRGWTTPLRGLRRRHVHVDVRLHRRHAESLIPQRTTRMWPTGLGS